MNEWSENRGSLKHPPDARSVSLCAIIAAMALASACIAVQVSRHGSAQLQQRADAADRAWNEAARQAQEAVALQQSLHAIAAHAEQAKMLLPKTPGSEVLADVTNCLPPGCWLEDVRLDASDAGGDGLRVQLSGRAPGDGPIGQYVARLRQVPQLQNVKLSASQAAPELGRQLRQFRIDLSIGGPTGQAAPSAAPTLTASIGHSAF